MSESGRQPAPANTPVARLSERIVTQLRRSSSAPNADALLLAALIGLVSGLLLAKPIGVMGAPLAVAVVARNFLPSIGVDDSQGRSGRLFEMLTDGLFFCIVGILAFLPFWFVGNWIATKVTLLFADQLPLVPS